MASFLTCSSWILYKLSRAPSEPLSTKAAGDEVPEVTDGEVENCEVSLLEKSLGCGRRRHDEGGEQYSLKQEDLLEDYYFALMFPFYHSLARPRHVWGFERIMRG